MSPHVIKMKFTLTDLVTNGYAWLATIFSWIPSVSQADVEFGMRVMMTASAVLVSVVTVYYKIKNNGKDSSNG